MVVVLEPMVYLLDYLFGSLYRKVISRKWVGYPKDTTEFELECGHHVQEVCGSNKGDYMAKTVKCIACGPVFSREEAEKLRPRIEKMIRPLLESLTTSS